MKVLKDNLIEIFLLLGIALVSVGFFVWAIIAGLIVTGFMLLGLAYIVYKGGG